MSYFALTLMLVGTFFSFRNPILAVATSIHLKVSENSGVKDLFIPISVYFLIFISYCSGLRFWFNLVTWGENKIVKISATVSWLLSCRFLFLIQSNLHVFSQ